MNYRCRCEPCVIDYKRYRSDYRAKNREKIAAAQHAYYEANKAQISEAGKLRSREPGYKLQRKAVKFGLSVKHLESLLSTGLCAICGTDEPGVHGWHIDHDHSCCPDNGRSCGKCVRGILCHKCNVGLGHFDDDIARMQRAVDYLNNTSAK